ncbi:uncharacterized protein LOC107266061 isoform X2 [Cephus cinctus]|uniref:Uncharacterized protein LOC107266061 isoform X2 n=1 Tax=Cephus cinctus TaxID=211228 RepID=A0AAJ7RER5_CEPCN|nr:uncharacterized protein LOC107266061 isoform X2 [Cephus cinctus]
MEQGRQISLQIHTRAHSSGWNSSSQIASRGGYHSHGSSTYCYPSPFAHGHHLITALGYDHGPVVHIGADTSYTIQWVIRMQDALFTAYAHPAAYRAADI